MKMVRKSKLCYRVLLSDVRKKGKYARGEKGEEIILMQNCEDWGAEFNLELCWTSMEHGRSENRTWTTSRGLVWLRKPYRIAASVFVNDAKQYAIHTQGLYGMSNQELEALKKHLESKGLTQRDRHD